MRTQENPLNWTKLGGDIVGKLMFLRGGSMTRPPMTIGSVAKMLRTKDRMTHKKLQKLCYYAYAWHLALYGQRLFAERFQAWIHGPVEPSLYQTYREYGWRAIPKLRRPPAAPAEVASFLDQLYESYGGLSGEELEALAHTEIPWQEARGGLKPWEPSVAELDDAIIREFYRERLAREHQSE